MKLRLKINLSLRYSLMRKCTDALVFFGADMSVQLSSKAIENPQTISEHIRKPRQELSYCKKT